MRVREERLLGVRFFKYAGRRLLTIGVRELFLLGVDQRRIVVRCGVVRGRVGKLRGVARGTLRVGRSLVRSVLLRALLLDLFFH